ncbi:MAG: surface-adhesin E family protein [Gemmatirosa sp.]
MLLAVLTPAAVALLALAPSSSPAPARDWAWRPVLAFDEVAVDVDSLTVSGTGPYMVQLRWSFHERVASPQAWDAGVRYSIDVVEIDCRAGATRTWASSAYTRAGEVVQDLSYVHDAPQWSRHRAESIGGLLARSACTALDPRG